MPRHPSVPAPLPRRAIVASALACAAALAGCALLLRTDTFLARGAGFQDPARLPWMLQHMAELYPTRTIARGGPIHALPPADRPLLPDGLTFRVGERTTGFDEAFAHGRVAGLVVLHEGKLVYERYALGADASTRFTSWSVAKSFTSTLVGLALGEGLVSSLDEPIERYVPEAKGTGYEGVAIRQALQMSSGVRFREVYTDGGSDVVEFVTQSMVLNRARANALAIDFPRAHPPGTVFNYNTAETQVLGEVLRNATGRSPSAYLEEKLWRRLGMEHDATWVLDREGPAGMEMTGCCLNMTLRDEARFGQLFLQDGTWEGERVLPAGWVARATVPEPGAAHLHFPVREDGLPAERGYGYQWWWLGDGAYAAEGVRGQFIWVDPKRRVVIARASAWPVDWDDELGAEAFAEFTRIAEELATTSRRGGGGLPPRR